MDGRMVNKSNLLKVLLFALIVAGALFFALRQRPTQPIAIGGRAPDFTLPTLSSRPIALHDLRKRVVVLNFWATWCPPCVEETPSLEKFTEQVREQGVIVIGVSVDQDSAALQKFVNQARLSFPIARDPYQSVAARYGTYKFPETYIIDRDGRVAEKVIGPTNWQDPRIITFVADLSRGLVHPGQ
jgi:peroxiredoxin